MKNTLKPGAGGTLEHQLISDLQVNRAKYVMLPTCGLQVLETASGGCGRCLWVFQWYRSSTSATPSNPYQLPASPGTLPFFPSKDSVTFRHSRL